MQTKPVSTNPALAADPADPDDFDVSRAGVIQGQRARDIRLARTTLGLTQEAFARRFHVPVGTLRDWEQARVMPPDFAVAYIQVIAAAPDVVDKALSA